MFATGSIILLYFWTYFSGDVGAGILISSIAVIAAGVAFFVSIVSYLWIPSQHINYLTGLNYALFVATTASVVVTSGNLHSPFIALWVLAGIFAAVFGIWGLLSLFLIGSYYILLEAYGGAITQTTLFVTLLAGWVPLVASY